MITRIVKMTFQKEKTEDFTQLFIETRDKIQNFDGCSHLELWRAHDDPRIFFTHSRWESTDHLEKYRQSALFKETWRKTKALFEERAEAWTVSTPL